MKRTHTTDRQTEQTKQNRTAIRVRRRWRRAAPMRARLRPGAIGAMQQVSISSPIVRLESVFVVVVIVVLLLEQPKQAS
jgi:hypothetical protein